LTVLRSTGLYFDLSFG